MKSSFRTVLAALVVALCAACTLNPTFTPGKSGIGPGASAITYSLEGNLTQRFVYYQDYPTPAPPFTIVAKVRDQILVSAATSPPDFPLGSTHDIRVAEHTSTKLGTTFSSVDSYMKTSQGKSELFGSTSKIAAADGGQSTIVRTVYASPQIVSEEASATWSNSPAATIDETYGDGHDEKRTIASDGTYVEIGSAFNSVGTRAKIRIIERATGSGSYAGPFLGGTPSNVREAIYAPSGSPPQITFAVFFNGLRHPADPMPAWFDKNPTLYKEENRSYIVRAPKVCGKMAGVRALEVDRTQQRLDVVIGYREVTQQRSYETSTGPVCIELIDKIDNFYSWQDDTPYVIGHEFNRKPLSAVITHEILTRSDNSANIVEPFGAVDPNVAAEVPNGIYATFSARIGVQRIRLRDALSHHFAAREGDSR